MKRAKEKEAQNQVISGNMTSMMLRQRIKMIGPNLENIGVELGERKVKIEAGTGLGVALDQGQEEVGGDRAQEKAETGLKMIQEVGQDLDQEEDRRRGEGEESSRDRGQDHHQHQKAPDLGQNITTLGQDLPQEV